MKGTQTAIHLPGLLSFASVSVRGKDVYRVRPEQGLGLCRQRGKPELQVEKSVIHRLDGDIAAGGVGPLLTIWARTRGNINVKAAAAINSMPLYLNTINPNVKSIKDFKETDRIAAMATELRKLGAGIVEGADFIEVAPPRPWRSASFAIKFVTGG